MSAGSHSTASVGVLVGTGVSVGIGVADGIGVSVGIGVTVAVGVWLIRSMTIVSTFCASFLLRSGLLLHIVRGKQTAIKTNTQTIEYPVPFLVLLRLLTDPLRSP